MNKKEREQYRACLMEERKRILEDLNHLQDEALNHSPRDSSGNLSGYSVHLADIADDDYTRSFNLGLVAGKRELLDEIDEALNRIDDDTYGKCENCEGKITLKRLKAKPSARYCLKCARGMEKESTL